MHPLDDLADPAANVVAVIIAGHLVWAFARAWWDVHYLTRGQRRYRRQRDALAHITTTHRS